jgi:hypothetical protein
MYRRIDNLSTGTSTDKDDFDTDVDDTAEDSDDEEELLSART